MNQEEISNLKRFIGMKVRIIYMDGEPSYEGREGIVEMVDDAGQLHCTWGGLAIIYGTDSFQIIKEEKK